MTTLTLQDFTQDESVAAESLAKLIRDEPGAADAVFGNFHIERRMKPTINPETGNWDYRPMILTKDSTGRIVSELPELGDGWTT